MHTHFRRRILSSFKFHVLPNAYQQVEYLQSDGGQYIDTGVQFLFGDDYEMDFMKLSSVSGENKGYGAGIDAGSHNITGGGRESGGVIAIYNGANANYSPTISAASSYRIRFIEHTSIGINLLSTLTNIFSGQIHNAQKQLSLGEGYYSGNNVYLFKDNSTSYPYPSAIRLYSWKHHREGDIIIRDFIPCIRKSDNKPGLYDLCGSICPLTGTPFYINAGSGEFTPGPTV